MSPAALIAAAQTDGVNLVLTETGGIKAVGDDGAVARWVPILRPHKPAIIACLRGAANEPAPAFRSWRVALPDGGLLSVMYVPPAAAEQVRRDYQGASVAPVPEHQAEALPRNDPHDDRRYCEECLNLSGGVCTIAHPGGLVSANRGYRPNPEMLIRCEGFRQSAIRCRQAERPPEPEPAKSCETCAHAARPGLRNLHCGGDRPDLPPAYGPGHPLRKIPGDGGASCGRWQSTNQKDGR